MSIYQQINVATHANVGAPGPLLANLVGLSDETLADLSAHLDTATMADPAMAGLQGTGFVPVATPPPSVRILSHYDFMMRIPQPKRVAIRASTDGVVVDFVAMMGAATNVNLDDPQTDAGLNYCVSVGLLAADDVTAILA